MPRFGYFPVVDCIIAPIWGFVKSFLEIFLEKFSKIVESLENRAFSEIKKCPHPQIFTSASEGYALYRGKRKEKE